MTHSSFRSVFVCYYYRILFVEFFVVVDAVLAAVSERESEVACGRVKQSFCNVV